MANIKSAKKRIKTSLKAKKLNNITKLKFRTVKKAILKKIDNNETNQDALQTEFRKFQKFIDKAVTKNVVKKNTAARLKSRLNKKIAQSTNAS